MFESMGWLLDIIVFFAVYLIVTLALNLQYGYTGIPNFGLALSVAVGAYTTGALAGRIGMWLCGIRDLDYIMYNAMITSMINNAIKVDPMKGLIIFTLTILTVIVVCAFIGFIASYPAIRLKADYLMMVLIAMAEAARIIGLNYTPLVGGTTWVSVPNIFIWIGDFASQFTIILTLIISILIFVFMQFIVSSPFGRLIKSIRENELTAECIGKDVVNVKIKIMMLGSAIAGIGGSLWSFYLGTVLAAAYTRTDWTFWPWLMAMIGGIGNNIGALVGVAAVIFIRRLIIYYKYSIEAYIPFSVVWLEQLLLGVALILVMIFRPQGLIPEKPKKIKRK
ncbi:MAG: branched-chain amino acid ABC transporter permease [Candidatus Methanomethylicia archaeon]